MPATTMKSNLFFGRSNTGVYCAVYDDPTANNRYPIDRNCCIGLLKGLFTLSHSSAHSLYSGNGFGLVNGRSEAKSVIENSWEIYAGDNRSTFLDLGYQRPAACHRRACLSTKARIDSPKE